jgi:hypothetical protein
MYLIRNTFVARPGQAGKLLAQMKETVSVGGLRNCRLLTDVSGDVNTVVMEHEVESLSEWEAIMERYRSDPQIRAKSVGYTDLWTTGKRSCSGSLDASAGLIAGRWRVRKRGRALPDPRIVASTWPTRTT